MDAPKKPEKPQKPAKPAKPNAPVKPDAAGADNEVQTRVCPVCEKETVTALDYKGNMFVYSCSECGHEYSV